MFRFWVSGGSAFVLAVGAFWGFYQAVFSPGDVSRYVLGATATICIPISIALLLDCWAERR